MTDQHQELFNAVMVIVKCHHIRSYLEANDPKALEQCLTAVTNATKTRSPKEPEPRIANTQIWIASFTPTFCPNCGEPVDITSNVHTHRDYCNHVSFQCMECSTHFQRASDTSILNAADAEEGDLSHYAEIK